MHLSILRSSILHFPFHTSIFEDVPAHKRILFKLYLCSFGPIILSLRFVCAVFISSIIREPRLVTSPVFYSGILNWFVTSSVEVVDNGHGDRLLCQEEEGKSQVDEEQIDEESVTTHTCTISCNDQNSSTPRKTHNKSNRPMAFFFNHHCTYDPWFVKLAIRKQFGFNGKIMVKSNVYNNRYLSMILGRNAIQNFFVTSNSKLERFIDIYRDWVKASSRTRISCAHSSIKTALLKSPSRECLMLAPSGMTTHSKYQTPMYWEYFAEKDVEKVMVHVDVQNPFGLNLRSISTSITLSQLLCGIMPWLSIHVTFYPNIVSSHEEENDGIISSQEDVDCIVERLYTDKHHMIFCPDWKLGQRRKVDKYIENGEYNIFDPTLYYYEAEAATIQHTTPNGTRREKDLMILDVQDPIPSKLKNYIPDNIRIITSSLSGNNVILDGSGNQLLPSEILLWNPCKKRDRMIAAAFDILMYLPCRKIDVKCKVK